MGKLVRAAAITVLMLAPISWSVAQEDFSGLAASNPNAFVERVQSAMASQGKYTGPINGTLNATTIAAIYDVCESAGLLSECRVGPLSKDGAAAVVKALGGNSRETSQPEVVAEAPKPEGRNVIWRQSGTRNGIDVAVSLDGSPTIVTVSGVAEASDWTNILPLADIPARGGEEWEFEVEGSAKLLDGATATVRLAAYNAAGGYIGELTSGARMAGSELASYAASGAAPEGTSALRPYIQLRYPAGASPDDELTIESAVVRKSN